MMRSATDFLPRVISTLTNLATSTLLNFGSGRISRFGTSLLRGIRKLGGFRSLGPVLRTALLGDLAQRRVGLLGRRRIDPRADPPLLRRAGEGRDLRLGALRGAPLTH